MLRRRYLAAHLESGRDACCARQGDEQRAEIGAVSLADFARPSRIAIPPARRHLVVSHVIDRVVVNRMGLRKRICFACRDAPGDGTDPVIDDAQPIGLKKSIIGCRRRGDVGAAARGQRMLLTACAVEAQRDRRPRLRPIAPGVQDAIAVVGIDLEIISQRRLDSHIGDRLLGVRRGHRHPHLEPSPVRRFRQLRNRDHLKVAGCARLGVSDRLCGRCRPGAAGS